MLIGIFAVLGSFALIIVGTVGDEEVGTSPLEWLSLLAGILGLIGTIALFAGKTWGVILSGIVATSLVMWFLVSVILQLALFQ